MQSTLTKEVSVLGRSVPVFAIALVAMVGVGTAAVVHTFATTSETAEVNAPLEITESSFDTVYAGETATFEATVEHHADANLSAEEVFILSAANSDMTQETIEGITFNYTLQRDSNTDDGGTTWTKELEYVDSDPEFGEYTVTSMEGYSHDVIYTAFEPNHGDAFGPDTQWNKEYHIDFASEAQPDDYTAELEFNPLN